MNFCSRESQTAPEYLAGTGVRADAYVFLPVAKALWHSEEMNAGWASAEQLAAIRLARKSGVVTRLYNPPRDTSENECAILVYAAEGSPEPAALVPLAAAFSGRWAVDRAGKPRLAICTHGTRDRCCAKWGFAAYSAARGLFEAGRSPFEPIECSHLGGDRFAATGIFFPSGGMYAHLDSADLEALAAAELAGTVAADHYRGRVYEPALTQIVRAGLAKDGLFNHAAAPLAIAAHEPGAREAEVIAGGVRFVVAFDTVELKFYASCANLGEARRSGARRTVYAGARRLEPQDA